MTLLTRLDATDLERFTAAGHWTGDTIYALVKAQAERRPDKVAIREGLRDVTYRELVTGADELAAALEAAGLTTGSRVAAWMPSRAECAVALLACSRNGFVCAPSLHKDHSVPEVVELLRRMGAAALIAQRGYGGGGHHDVSEAAMALGSVKATVWLGPVVASGSEAGISSVLPDGRIDKPERTDPNSIVYLAFTSGSTGRPKGVMHSDNTLMAPIRALRRDWGLGAEMIVYSLSPLSHNLGFGAMVLALTAGGQLVVHDLPKGASLADRLAETGATFAFGVPTHAMDLLAELDEVPRDLGALKGFRVSGASVPPALVERLLARGILPQSGYGMTEAGSHHYTLPGDPPEVIAGTSGWPYEGYETRIFAADDADRPVPAGTVGQIGARGPSLMLGYFDDQFLTEAAFNSQGWFMTGDLGVVDQDDRLKVTGRKKDLIIRGGHNIYPARIEHLASRHPDVDKVSAVPVPDERLGERVCLVVQPRQGAAIDPYELLDHLAAEGLSRADMPEYFASVAEIPVLPSGKVARLGILELIREGTLAPMAVRYRPAEIVR